MIGYLGPRDLLQAKSNGEIAWFRIEFSDGNQLGMEPTGTCRKPLSQQRAEAKYSRAEVERIGLEIIEVEGAL